MAEKALSDKTNLHATSRDQGIGINNASGLTKGSKGGRRESKDTKEKSVRPKERLGSTKESSHGKTHHSERKELADQSAKGQYRRRQDGHRAQKHPREGQPGQAGEKRHYSRTAPKTPRSRGRAIEVDGCATNSHLAKRGSPLSLSREPADKRTFQPISSKFLKDLLQMEPTEAAIQLGSLKGSFKAGLEEPDIDPGRQRLFWEVLSHVSDNVGAASTVVMLLTLVINSRLFTSHLQRRLISLRAKTNQAGTSDCLGFIALLIAVFEAMVSCLPSRAAEIKVPLVLMTDVVNSLEEELTQDVKSPLDALVQYIESLEEEKELSRQKKRNASAEPPPDDFRKQNILPTYQELSPSYQPYLRPHIVKGAYPSADHYLDVQFRLMKEDFIQPLRSGLGEYLRYKQVRPGERIKVQDIRIYEDVKLKRSEIDSSGVSYSMSFKRIPQVKWAVSKRLLYGSLVLLSEDDFKTYIPATIANRDARQLALGSVDIRPVDVGMSSLVDRTFVMVESTVFFEAYRHVLVGLQRVGPESFPMARHILDLDHDIKPPTYLQEMSYPMLDLLNLMADRKSNTKVSDLPVTKPDMAASRIEFPHTYSLTGMDEDEEAVDISFPDLPVAEPDMAASRIEFPRRYSLTDSDEDQEAVDNSFPVSVLNENDWPAAGKTNLNPSQLEAVKAALTQELSLIQGPPGTGKTYIGLKIVEALLRNIHCWADEETGPILLVCYTNHALDQFLLGILQFHHTGVIRVGSRSKCIELEKHNLKNVIRQERFEKKEDNRYIGRRAVNIRQEAMNVKQALEGLQTRMQLSTQGILTETEFKRFKIMSDKHFNSMMRMKTLGHADSWMMVWLVPYDISLHDQAPSLGVVSSNDNETNECETQKEEEEEEEEATTESIEVENERELIEAQRMFDDLGDDDTSEEKAVEKNDSLLAIYFKDLMASKDINKRVKNFLEEKISVQKKMNENVVSTIRDVWRLDLHQRWALYHYWLSEYLTILEAEIPVLQNDYTQLCAELQETNDQEKCLALQQATVVGMTTTRAANEREVLHRVKPKIIIVEEAAEVLESHIITSLHTSCEQLILIGDHQQLRPKPNVYQLATRFHLDVSMFERLVKNGFPYKKLKQQHRMRPEISSLMRKHFYPELEDHESVSFYDDVRGVTKNVFFLDHDKEEAHVGETMSHYNLHEVEFIVALCRYLLNQDYKPQQITILTAYTGQLLKFKERMDRATFEGVRVASVDNYQGEENDIIILSFVRSSQNGKIGFLNIANRVCVSLSRAKQGLYCIGNFTLYSKKCDLWKGIYSDLKANGHVGNRMMLQCYNHPQHKNEVARAADFHKVPYGGCGIPCDTLLVCGHVCRRLCHPQDRLHQRYVCPEPCTKTCQVDHPCPATCGEKCPPCPTKVEKELPCGHVKNLKCSTNPTRVTCYELVEKTKLPCNHLLTIPCNLNVDTFDCTAVVDRLLQCGHTKTERCSEHGSCSVMVSKDLPCGHKKVVKCSETTDPHTVCTEMIRKVLPCSHTKEVKCNVKPEEAVCLKVVTKTRQSCGHVVTERCSEVSDCTDIVNKNLPCGHHKDVKCCEDVNEVFCAEKCQENLSCGHKCTELCGNPCERNCKKLVTRRDWPCGHEVTVRCSDGPDTCKIRCETTLECGHICKGTCGRCMGGRYHIPCAEVCNRTLICGHKCTLKCVDPCLPCHVKCENFCDHIQCNHPCGELCFPCTKRCDWICPHHTCRMLCCEPCSRPPCNEPCLKKLRKCGHPCSGLCGEICPQLCRICDKEALKETSFGSQNVEALRYIQLEECGHVFEVTGLDEHMGINQPETTNSLISLKRCPKCRTPLRHSRRYEKIIKLSLRHVLHVKRKLEAKERQVAFENSGMQRKMKNTMTRRNLGPLGIQNHLISRWLRAHEVITMKNEQVMNRLQLVRTLMELRTTLRESTKETTSAGKPRRKTQQSRQSMSNELMSETQGYIEVLADAVLRDVTSFSYQQAHDLYKEISRITYTVLLLIQLQRSTGRQHVQSLEDSLTALRRKAYLRDEELERIRSILDDHYRITGGKWPDNIQEFHLQRQMTFARERWCRCPKGHTFMLERDESSIQKVDCKICLNQRARAVSNTTSQGSLSRHTSASHASNDQTAKGLTEGEIRQLAIAVPSCGIRRGPREMPYNNKRSVKNTPMNPIDSGSSDRSPGNVGSSVHNDGSSGKSMNQSNVAESNRPTAGVNNKAGTVLQEKSKRNRRRRQTKNADFPSTLHTQGTEERICGVSRTDTGRKGAQHPHGDCDKDQTLNSKANRATTSKSSGTPKTAPTASHDTSKSCGASQGRLGRSDNIPKIKNQPNMPKGKTTGNDRKAVQSKTSKSTVPDVTTDRGQSGASHRRTRRRGGGRSSGRGGGSTQVDDREGRPSDDARKQSRSAEQGTSNSRSKNTKKKGKGNESK